jgi:hypothetical protein
MDALDTATSKWEEHTHTNSHTHQHTHSWLFYCHVLLIRFIKHLLQVVYITYHKRSERLFSMQSWNASAQVGLFPTACISACIFFTSSSAWLAI